MLPGGRANGTSPSLCVPNPLPLPPAAGTQRKRAQIMPFSVAAPTLPRSQDHRGLPASLRSRVGFCTLVTRGFTLFLSVLWEDVKLYTDLDLLKDIFSKKVFDSKANAA